VECCNELNAAYAADEHARTCGLSAICGDAGSYAEHFPVVATVVAPPLGDIESQNLLHHTAGGGTGDTETIGTHS